MTSQAEKLAAPCSVIPEPEHNAFEPIFYANQHLQAWMFAAMASKTRVISGEIVLGQVRNLRVLFSLADGSKQAISFPDTDISVGDNRKVYYADFITETILSIDLPAFESFFPDENEFPIVHAVRYQDTPVSTEVRLEWIGPRTDVYDHVPIGKVIALHPFAPDPDSYFFKAMDGTGVLGNNFPGHEADAIPNLTDNRFLMGSSDFGTLTGGSNVMLEHTHACGDDSPDHSHYHDHPNTGSGGFSADHSHAMGAAPYAGGGGTSGGYTEMQPRGGNAYTGGASVNHSHATDIGGMSSGGASTRHAHSIGSGADCPNTLNIPQYFKVKYFLRIN